MYILIPLLNNNNKFKYNKYLPDGCNLIVDKNMI